MGVEAEKITYSHIQKKVEEKYEIHDEEREKKNTFFTHELVTVSPIVLAALTTRSRSSRIP